MIGEVFPALLTGEVFPALLIGEVFPALLIGELFPDLRGELFPDLRGELFPEALDLDGEGGFDETATWTGDYAHSSSSMTI